jgi:hypothetical protein
MTHFIFQEYTVVSIGQAADIPGTTFKPNISQVIVRLGNTFRF